MQVCPICKNTYPDDVLFCPLEGGRLVLKPKNEIFLSGQTLGEHYNIGQIIEKKEEYDLYEGIAKITGQKILVKLLPLSVVQKQQPQFVQCLEILNKKCHPSLVQVLSFGIYETEWYYIVTEFITGKSLDKLLENCHHFSVLLSVEVAKQILMGLDFLQNQGILYVAFLPSQIFLLESLENVLIVKLDLTFPQIPLEKSKTSSSKICYIPPEIFYAQGAKPQSNVYVVGVILYQMITGITPIIIDDDANLPNKMPQIPKIREIYPSLSISRRMEKYIFQAMHWDFHKRFQNEGAFLAALNKTQSQRIVSKKSFSLVFLVFFLALLLHNLYLYGKDWHLSFRYNNKKFPPMIIEAFKDSESKYSLKIQPFQEKFQKELEKIQKMVESKDFQSISPMVEIKGGRVKRRNSYKDSDETWIEVPPFFIDCTEVTNLQYYVFVKHTGHPAPPYWTNGKYPEGMEDYPVVEVTWYDAALYSAWCGKKLPSEIQWEMAAHGGAKISWPWGEHFLLENANVQGESLLPVGSFRKRWDSSWQSPSSLCDMIGNVWEWTDSWYNPYWKQDKIIKGGSFLSTPLQSKIEYCDGFFPGARRRDIGFRCVREK